MTNLITLEGLDGSGKSTAIEHLKDALEYPSDHLAFRREPTQDTKYGNYVYDSIDDDTADPLAELYLYMADHANHTADQIRPLLNSGQNVVCDRYIDSRIAYQSATLEDTLDNPYEYIRTLHEEGPATTPSDSWTRFPDLTIYLDISPETAVERSGRTNKFETLDHLRSVETYYDQLAQDYSDRFHVIDGEQPEHIVKQELTNVVHDHLDQ